MTKTLTSKVIAHHSSATEADKAAGHFHQWFSAKERGDHDIASLSLREINRYLQRLNSSLIEGRPSCNS